MEIALKYQHADNGYCRVYYRGNPDNNARQKLFCWQLEDNRQNLFTLYVCSQGDGEPSIPVADHVSVTTEPPQGHTQIEKQLRAFLHR